MYEAEYLIFCKGIAVEENGFTLQQTFDTIFFTSLPMVYSAPLVVLAKLKTKRVIPAGNFVQKLVIEHDGDVVETYTRTLPGRHTPKGQAIYMQEDIINQGFTKAGTYYVSLYINDKKIITRALTLEPLESKESFDEQKIIQAID